LVFNKIFFPNLDPSIALLVAYAGFGVSFFFRPLGGILFSHLGDKIGRKKTLILTLLVMGIGTSIIGLLPSYQSIGIAAPILLILMRIVQGIGLGGEWGGSMLLAVEYAAPEKKGLFGSVPMIGVYIGMVMGTASISLLSMLPGNQFLEWGWRVPFLFSLVLVFIGLWIRKEIDETPEFREAQKKGNLAKFPLGETLRLHWREVLLTFGIKPIESAPFYLFSIFGISYATKNMGYSQATALNAVTIAVIITGIAIPFMGALSDKIGRKRLFAIGACCVMLYVFPFFHLLSLKSNIALYIAVTLGLLMSSPLTAIIGTLFSEVFSTKVRYTGISLGFHLGTAVSGGVLPFVATALLGAFNNRWEPIAVYLIFYGVVSLSSLYLTNRFIKNRQLRAEKAVAST
jgi:MFS family permease